MLFFFPSKFIAFLVSISLIILPSRKWPKAIEEKRQLAWASGLAQTHWVAFQSSFPLFGSGPLLWKEIYIRHSSQSLAGCLAPEVPH